MTGSLDAATGRGSETKTAHREVGRRKLRSCRRSVAEGHGARRTLFAVTHAGVGAFELAVLELATEDELADLFPDCEVGVIPPFGSLYGLQTWVDSRLTEDDHIGFDGQSHDQALRVSYSSYEAIKDPRVADLACQR